MNPPVTNSTLTLTRRQRWSDTVAQAALIGLFFTFPIAISLGNILMALFVLAWLTGGRYRQRWLAIRHHPITLPSLLLYGMVVVGLLYTPVPLADTTSHLNKYLKLIIGLGMLSVLVDNPTLRRRCLQAFGLAMLITLALTYVNIWFDPPWSRTRSQGLGVDHTVFKDYIAQGIMLSMLALLCLGRAFSPGPRGLRALAVVAALLTVFAITNLSAGRTGYLALFAALVAFVPVALPRKGRWPLLALATGLAGLIALSPFVQQRLAVTIADARSAQVTDVTADTPITSTGARLAMIELSRKAIRDKPLLGSGTGSYQSLAEAAFPDPTWCAVVCVHPHNQFLFFGVEQGLVGMLLFSWYLWRVARRGVAYTRPYNGVVLGFLGIFLTDSLVHGGLWLSTESHFLVFMTVLLLSRPTPSERTP